MIKNFKEFLLEKDGEISTPSTPDASNVPKTTTGTPDALSEDAKISNIFQEIDRNYNNYPSLGAQHLSDIIVLQEIRSWGNFLEKAKLEEEVTEPCKFFIKYEKEADVYQVQVNFDITYEGVENFDIPEPDYGHQKRMGVSLKSLSLKRIKVKSSSISFDSENFSKDLGKTVLRFLLNIFKPEFDTIGDEALIIRQL